MAVYAAGDATVLTPDVGGSGNTASFVKAVIGRL